MTLIAFAALPAYGHVYPLLPLAEALQRAGAEVSVAVGPPFLGSLPLPTVPGIEPDLTLDRQAEVFERFPQVREDMAARWGPAFFGDVSARRVLPVLREQWGRDRPDLVIYEVLNVGASVAADQLGVPSVAFGLGHFQPRFASLAAVAADATAPAGPSGLPWEVAASAVETSRDRPYLDPMPPSLQLGPVDLLTERMPLRPVGWHDPGAEATAVPPHRPDGPPRVYITLGTVAYGAVEVLRQATLEAAALGAEVVVACGPHGDPELIGPVPDNVHLSRYLPQAALLPTVDVVVHHGGAGTMLTSAAHGIPQVVLPQGADQFRNAESVQAAGVGRAIRKETLASGAVGEAIAALLGECPERDRAAALRGEIAGMPSPDEVATQLLHRL
ncbi:MAG: glycosyltransferase [Dermatophilaceae bacterium]